MNMMKKVMLLFLVFSLILPTASQAAVQERDVVQALKAGNVVKGDSSGDVHEDQQLKREELIAILVRMADATYDGSFSLPSTPSFKDVPTNHWSFEVVEKAKHYGLTTGIGNGLFGLGQYVTYQQALTFITRLVGHDLPWDSVIDEAAFLGFSSPEPAAGGKFLRGHMFDLTLKAIRAFDYETEQAWGQHVLVEIEKNSPGIAERINNWETFSTYLTNQYILLWPNSPHANADELATRFDATKVQWTETDFSVLKDISFFITLPDPEYGEMDWTVSYDEEARCMWAKFDNVNFGGAFNILIDKVSVNNSLSFGGENVQTYSVLGSMMVDGRMEPYHMVIQAKDKVFINGWFDSLSITRSLNK